MQQAPAALPGRQNGVCLAGAGARAVKQADDHSVDITVQPLDSVDVVLGQGRAGHFAAPDGGGVVDGALEVPHCAGSGWSLCARRIQQHSPGVSSVRGCALLLSSSCVSGCRCGPRQWGAGAGGGAAGAGGGRVDVAAD